MCNRYNWRLNKDTYDLSEFKKAMKKEIRKALKPIKDYIKVSAHKNNGVKF